MCKQALPMEQELVSFDPVWTFVVNGKKCPIYGSKDEPIVCMIDLMHALGYEGRNYDSLYEKIGKENVFDVDVSDIPELRQSNLTRKCLTKKGIINLLNKSKKIEADYFLKAFNQMFPTPKPAWANINSNAPTILDDLKDCFSNNNFSKNNSYLFNKKLNKINELVNKLDSILNNLKGILKTK